MFYKWTTHVKAHDLISSLKSPFCQMAFKQYFTNFNSNKEDQRNLGKLAINRRNFRFSELMK